MPSMAPGAASNRRLILVLGFTVILILVWMTSHHSGPTRQPYEALPLKEPILEAPNPSTPKSSLTGHAIARKIGNETLKAELGRAAWKLFHTTMAQFPDEPTRDESEALRQYIHLFQRLYPCGECAEHFGQLLGKFPPQVSSRSAAAVWACHVHNEVNKSLKKELFDCSKIGDFYDCGCADDEKDDTAALTRSSRGGQDTLGVRHKSKEALTGWGGGNFEGDGWREMA